MQIIPTFLDEFIQDFHSYNSSEKLPIFLNISIIKKNKRIQRKKVLLGAIGKMYESKHVFWIHKDQK